MKKSAKCDFFVNLIKKSLTIRFWCDRRQRLGLIFFDDLIHICQRNRQAIDRCQSHGSTAVDCQNILTDILNNPVDLPQTLQAGIFVMPLIFASNNTDGIDGGCTVTGKDDIPDLHFVDKGVQHNTTTGYGKVSFIGNILAVVIPSNADMIVFQTFGSGGVIAGSFQRYLPNVGAVANAVVSRCCCSGTLSLFAETLKYARLYTILDFTGLTISIIRRNNRSDTLNKFFVTVGLVEGGKFDPPLRFIFVIAV